MIKEEIITAIAKETGQRQAVVGDIIESLLENITKELSDGNKVKFSGFGTFESKKRAARTGRNPHTGETIQIPRRVVPYFKPGIKLKNAILQGSNNA